MLLDLALAGLVCGALPLPGALLVWVCYLSLAAQAWILGEQIRRRNFLCAAAGFCLTAMLFMGLLIPAMWRPSDLNGYLNVILLLPSLTTLASRLLLLTSSLYYAVVLALAPTVTWKWKPPGVVERRAARLLTLPALISGIVLYFLTRQGALITSLPYPSNAQAGAGILSSNSGLDLIAPFLLVCAMVAACRGYGLSSRRYRRTVAAALVAATYFSLLRGNRVGILFVVSTALFLFYLCSRMPRFRKSLTVVATLMVTFFLLQVWGSARTTAAYIGLGPAMAEGWKQMAEPMIERFDPTQVQMLPQSYWHLLEAEYLVEGGLSAHGATVYPLLGESVPESFARLIHYRRPLNSAWLIGQYGISSAGGMYVVAEGYWNFGLPGALGLATILALIAVGFERWSRQQEPLLAFAYFAFLGGLSFGIFYGLEPFARALEVAVALAVCARLGMNAFGKSPRQKWSALRVPRSTGAQMPSRG